MMDVDIFFELSPVACYCINSDWQLVKWNEAFERLSGKKIEAPISLLPFIPFKYQQQVGAVLTSLIKGEIKESIFAVSTATDSPQPQRWKIYKANNELIYVFQQPQSLPQPALPQVEENSFEPVISSDAMLNLLNQSSDLLARFDRQLRYTFVNNELIAQTSGLCGADFLGKTTAQMAPVLGVPESNFDRWTKDLQQVLETGKELMHYDSLKLPTHTLHFQTKMFPEYNGQQVTGILVITRIINELKYSQQQLNEQKNLLRKVFDCMQEGVMVVDTQQRFVVTNHTARTTIRISPTTKDYQDWAQQVESYYPDRQTILPPGELPALKALRGEKVHNQLGYYKHRLASEGIFLSVNANPLVNEQGQVTGAVVVFNDVSERIKAQQQLASSFATLNSIIESTHDMVVAIDTTYTVITVNSTAREIFKVNTSITIDKGTNLLQVLVDMPAAAERVKNAWYDALQGNTYSSMHQSSNLRYYESVYSPIYSLKGEIAGAIMVGRDVTEKLRQEAEIKGLLNRLMQLNQQLEEKNKALIIGEEDLSAANEKLISQQHELKQIVEELASRNFELDQLVYKTSHDIRSPLTSILGLANVMKAEKDTSQWPVYLSHIENRVLTLDRFVQSMISYAKANRGELHIQQIDFTQLITQTKHDLAYMKGYESLTIRVNYEGDTTAFYGDPFRLQILFNNIISNAIKYQNPYIDTHYLQITIQLEPRQAMLTFTDNGIGIKSNHQAKIFDMFYRATENTDGSGLGLYIVKQTVEKMKGKISFKSQYGQMTQFEVVLPNAIRPEMD